VASSSSRHPYIFTSGKEGHIIKWDLSSGKKLDILRKQRPSAVAPASKSKGKTKAKASNDVEGHTSELYALALSDDGTVLASGGKDRRLGVWDAFKGEWIRGFPSGGLGHRDSISVS
jgi:ribosomal RNA-processing protein 9